MSRYAIIGLILSLFVGCGKDFDPRSLLTSYRVMGLVAEPPEVGIGDSVQLTAIEHIEDRQMIQREWSVCLLSLGVFGDFACLDDGLIIELDETKSSFTLALNADGIDFANTFLNALNSVDLPTQTPDECGAMCLSRDGKPQTYVDVELRLRSGPAQGPKMTTIKSLRVNFDPQAPNQNPKIKALKVDGNTSAALVKGGEELTLSIEIDDTSLEEYVEASSGVKRVEEPTMSWFTNEGEFEKQVTANDRRETVLVLPSVLTRSQIDVYVVVRDGRGGTAYRHVAIPTQQSPNNDE